MLYRHNSDELDNTLLALADPTRREILAHLSRGEARVTEVASHFPISLNAVSKHIRLLERGRLIQRRIQGRDHFLCLRPAAIEAIQEWLTHQQHFWQANLAAIADLLDAGTPPSPRTSKRKKS